LESGALLWLVRLWLRPAPGPRGGRPLWRVKLVGDVILSATLHRSSPPARRKSHHR
jgi:hypothetical protein